MKFLKLNYMWLKDPYKIVINRINSVEKKADKADSIIL